MYFSPDAQAACGAVADPAQPGVPRPPGLLTLVGACTLAGALVEYEAAEHLDPTLEESAKAAKWLR